MKKSSKPLIIIVASFLVLVTLIILISQGLRLKYEALQRELTELENQIKKEKTQSVAFKANYQMLTAEERIKPFAIHELGLISSNENGNSKIFLSMEDIARLAADMENMNE